MATNERLTIRMKANQQAALKAAAAVTGKTMELIVEEAFGEWVTRQSKPVKIAIDATVSAAATLRKR